MEKTLKTYNIDTKSFFDSVITTSKEENGGYLFEYKCGDLFLIGRGDSPFATLIDIRNQLNKMGLILLCEGARVDVFPSGFSFTSFLAYKVIMGKPGSKEDLVNILDSTDDINMIGSPEEQEEYRIKWGNSLK